MRLNFIFLILVTFLFSCGSDEPPLVNYSVFIKNETINTLKYQAFLNGDTIDKFIVAENTEKLLCGYAEEFFIGLSGCAPYDSVRITFPNKKGYIDLKRNNRQNPFRFTNNKTLFSGNINNDFYNDGVNFFIITEEDYENAHDLP